MGLIKAAVGALGGTLGDTWKEAIHCEALNNKVILRCGTKMNSGSSRSSNTKGTENYISNGSTIIVEENTCMLTIDNGKITNVAKANGTDPDDKDVKDEENSGKNQATSLKEVNEYSTKDIIIIGVLLLIMKRAPNGALFLQKNTFLLTQARLCDKIKITNIKR